MDGSMDRVFMQHSAALSYSGKKKRVAWLSAHNQIHSYKRLYEGMNNFCQIAGNGPNKIRFKLSFCSGKTVLMQFMDYVQKYRLPHLETKKISPHILK